MYIEGKCVGFFQDPQTRRRTQDIDLLVIHYAHIRGLQNTVNYFLTGDKRDGRQVSVTYVVGNDGKYAQMLRDDQVPWTNGESWFLDKKNKSISKWTNGRSITFEIAVRAGDEYSPECYTTMAEICKWYLKTKTYTHILRIAGHEHVCPHKKVDPGKTWDWKKFFIDYMGVYPEIYDKYLKYLDEAKMMKGFSKEKKEFIWDAWQKLKGNHPASKELMKEW